MSMKPLRVLITGGTGLLGKTLVETAPEDCEVLATYYQNRPPAEWQDRFYPIDVRDESAVAHLWNISKPQVVIHTAGIGSVDEAERNPDVVHHVNVEGTKNVGRACDRLGALFVFISSNAVFDGLHPPYRETSPLRAITRYGALKIEAEMWVRERRSPHLIIRPILMYGWPLPGGRDNAVTRWLAQLEKGCAVEVAEDIYSTPLWAPNCAEAIWVAVKRHRTGTYHVAGADRVSLVTFAKRTACAFGCDDRLVTPVPSRWFTSLAPRPRDTSFVTTKMEQELGVRPLGLTEGLARMHRTRLVSATE